MDFPSIRIRYEDHIPLAPQLRADLIDPRGQLVGNVLRYGVIG